MKLLFPLVAAGPLLAAAAPSAHAQYRRLSKPDFPNSRGAVARPADAPPPPWPPNPGRYDGPGWYGRGLGGARISPGLAASLASVYQLPGGPGPLLL